MRSRIHILVLSVAIAALAASGSTPVEAAKRGAGMGVGQCWIEGTPYPAGPGESISSCCLEDGCWICSATWNDCTWDPKVRSVGNRRPAVNVAPGGMTVDPGPATRGNPVFRRPGGAVAP